MSAPSNIPTLKAATFNGIHAYLTESAKAITKAAADQQTQLQQRAQVVNGIFQSVMDNCSKQITLPGKVVNKTLDDLMAAKAQKPVVIQGTDTVFDYKALKDTVRLAHQVALETIELLQPPLVPAEKESASSKPEQQQDDAAGSSLLLAFTSEQVDLTALMQHTEPFVFTGSPAPQELPLVVSKPLSPVAEQRKKQVLVPPLVLTGFVAANAGQPADVSVPGTPQSQGTPKSEAPESDSDDDSQIGDKRPFVSDRAQREVTANQTARLTGNDADDEDKTASNTPVSARSRVESEGGKETAETEDHHAAATEEEAASGDELEEEEEITERPVDTVIATGTKGYSCRPGRKSACAAVTAAFTGVGIYFQDAVAQTVVPVAHTLWSGVQQRGAQVVALAAQLWESAPKREQVVQIVAESTVGQALVNEDDVSPAVPGLKVKHVAQAGLAASVLTFVGLGYCLSRKSKEKAE